MSTVFRYVDREGVVAYYDATGQSSRRTFLKSPLKFAHVTLGLRHALSSDPRLSQGARGVDYAAEVGTPVWAIGDGSVEAAGFKGANGNYVALKHRNGLETFYCHLSRTPKASTLVPTSCKSGVIGIRRGHRPGHRPHLHQCPRRGGHFMNPLGLKLPRAEPISPRER